MDFLAALGIPLQIPYLGMILTGILVSRGANFMHDLLGSVNAIYQSKKDTNIIPPQEINPGGQITNSEKL
jgi:hypothetical protein